MRKDLAIYTFAREGIAWGCRFLNPSQTWKYSKKCAVAHWYL